MKDKISSINDLTLEDTKRIFKIATLKENIFSKFNEALNGKILGSIFLQPSTRTQLSFQSTFVRLGGTYIGFSDINHSRSGAPYYEPLDDMAKIVSLYCDIIVMRTINAQYTKDFLSECSVPFISAGSGNAEHPTQALTDLFTMQQVFGEDLSYLDVLIIGTPRQRTINSLVLGLSKWNEIKVHIICQPGIQFPSFVQENLSHPLYIDYFESVSTFLKHYDGQKIDVIYMDKLFSETNLYEGIELDEECLYQNFKKNVKIMHPLPRTKELPKRIDKHPGALYFMQAQNGIYVRAALFLSMLS